MPFLADDLPFDSADDDGHQDARRVAFGYVEDAFAEGQQDGLDPDALAHAALFAAFRTLVETYGEEPTAVFAETLAEKVRTGAFSRGTRH